MPLPVAHGIVGASIVAALSSRPSSKRRPAPLLVGAFLANAADFDFLLVFITHSKSWHRGFSHSFVFALFVFVLLALSLGGRRLREAAAYGLAFASHGLLDYATTRYGGGVQLLWPFSTGRFVLGWLGLSEVPSRLSLAEVLQALLVEVALFMPLLLAVLLLRKAAAKRAGSAAGAT